jgi:F0F1-type ATP synthase membrane subunit c/vacuolar-type H+-ATPase subunit K
MMRMRVILLLIALVVAIAVFGAGVLAGLTYTGKVAQLTRNIDLSDYISLTVILLLSLALFLSLRKSRPS